MSSATDHAVLSHLHLAGPSFRPADRLPAVPLPVPAPVVRLALPKTAALGAGAGRACADTSRRSARSVAVARHRPQNPWSLSRGGDIRRTARQWLSGPDRVTRYGHCPERTPSFKLPGHVPFSGPRPWHYSSRAQAIRRWNDEHVDDAPAPEGRTSPRGKRELDPPGVWSVRYPRPLLGSVRIGDDRPVSEFRVTVEAVSEHGLRLGSLAPALDELGGRIRGGGATGASTPVAGALEQLSGHLSGRLVEYGAAAEQ